MNSLLDSKWSVFLTVAEQGSLTRAAIVLNLPQPTLSRFISALETECGTRLFQRTGRGVALTEFAAQLLPQIASLNDEARRISDVIQSKGKVPIGEVRVGILPSTVAPLASNLYAAVKAQLPQVRLHLIEGSNVQLAEQLRDGRLDFALLIREGDKVNRDERILNQTELHLVGLNSDKKLRGSTIALKDLAGFPLIVPALPHPLRIRLEALAQELQIKLLFSVTADSINLQHEIAAGGGGYAISSAIFELRHHRVLKAVKIINPRLLRSLALATSPRHPSTLATREVAKVITEIVPPLLYK